MLEHEAGNAWFNDVDTANTSIECRKGNTSRKAFPEASLLFRTSVFFGLNSSSSPEL